MFWMTTTSCSQVTMASLGEAYEDLLTVIWDCERWWQIEDRIDLAVQLSYR